MPATEDSPNHSEACKIFQNRSGDLPYGRFDSLSDERSTAAKYRFEMCRVQNLAERRIRSHRSEHVKVTGKWFATACLEPTK